MTFCFNFAQTLGFLLLYLAPVEIAARRGARLVESPLCPSDSAPEQGSARVTVQYLSEGRLRNPSRQHISGQRQECPAFITAVIACHLEMRLAAGHSAPIQCQKCK